MRNKLLALILALVMVVSLAAMIPAGAAGAEKIGSDIVAEAAKVLMTLNIVQGYEDGSLRLENNITRAEFAAMLARMLQGTEELNLNAGAIINSKMSETPENIAAVKAANVAFAGAPGKALANVGAAAKYRTDIDSTDLADPSFSDVSEIHWAYTDVEYLRGQGIVTGYSDGTFKPDNNITYEEAVKFVTSALGYDFMAVTYGGYPEGYLKTANQLKILKNVNGTSGVPVTREQVILLLFNALTADYLVLDSIKDGYNIYETGKSILKYVFNVDTMEGYVVATDDSGMYSMKSAADEGKIEIGGDVLTLYDESYKKYLGYNVKAYVRYDEDDSNTGDLLVLIPKSSARRITIPADDIIGAKTSGTTNELEAYVNDDKQSFKLDSDPVIIYNDVAYGRAISAKTFDIESGDVTLVATRGGSTFDLIYINSYVPMYVTNVKTSDKSVTGTIYSGGMTKDDYKLMLDEKSDKYDITATYTKADGTAGTFADITKDSVIYIRMWGNHYSIDLAGQTATGQITKKGAGYVVINDTKYEELEGSKLLSKYTSGDTVKLGLTKDGYVFYATTEIGSAAGNYGLLMDIHENTKVAFGDELELKILGADNKIAYYTAAENMKLIDMDGAEYKFNDEGKANSVSFAQLQTKLKNSAKYAGPQASSNLAAAGKGRPYEQVIKFLANENKEVTQITLARLASSIAKNDDKSAYFTVEDADVSGSGHHINKGVIYATPYNVATATTFLVSKQAKPKDEDYGVSKIGTGARDGKHGIVLFDVAESGVATVCLSGNHYTKSSTSADFNRTLVTIEYFTDAVVEKDDDKQDVYEISIINNGGYDVKYSLIDKSKGRDYFNDSEYYVGDAMNYTLWSGGYWYGVYNPGYYDKNDSSKAKYPGYFSIQEALERIIAGTPDQYFHYSFGTESWGNWEQELTFGKVRSVSGGKMIVSYDQDESTAIVCDINGKKAALYDCSTGYVKAVAATEVAEGDYVYLQQANKDFKFMEIYTNCDEADLKNIKQQENKRK